MNPFKEEEKRYKYYQHTETDFAQVIDVTKLNEEQLAQHEIIKNDNIFTFSYPKGVILVK